jgi:predicted nicotinamide N-methyase
MSPKQDGVAAKAKAEKKKADLAGLAAVAAAAALAEKAVKKGQQSNMVTSLKQGAAKNPEAAKLLAEYQSLDHRNEEKQILLDKWLADKSLKWVNEYFEQRTQKFSSARDGATGFCTK